MRRLSPHRSAWRHAPGFVEADDHGGERLQEAQSDDLQALALRAMTCSKRATSEASAWPRIPTSSSSASARFRSPSDQPGEGERRPAGRSCSGCARPARRSVRHRPYQCGWTRAARARSGSFRRRSCGDRRGRSGRGDGDARHRLRRHSGRCGPADPSRRSAPSDDLLDPLAGDHSPVSHGRSSRDRAPPMTRLRSSP